MTNALVAMQGDGLPNPKNLKSLSMPDHPKKFLAEVLDEFRTTLRQSSGAGAFTATIAADLEGVIERACLDLGINADGLGLLRAAETIRNSLFPESVLSGTEVDFQHFESLSRETIRSRALALILASANCTELEAPADLVFEWLANSGRLPTQVLEH